MACSHILGKMIKWGTVKTCQQSALSCCMLYDADENGAKQKVIADSGMKVHTILKTGL